MSDVRAGVAMTGTGGRAGWPGAPAVFDWALPEPTRMTYATTPSKTITPRAINHGLKRLIVL